MLQDGISIVVRIMDSGAGGTRFDSSLARPMGVGLGSFGGGLGIGLDIGPASAHRIYRQMPALRGNIDLLNEVVILQFEFRCSGLLQEQVQSS